MVDDVVVGVAVFVVVAVAVLTVVVRDAGLTVVVNGSVAGKVLIWKSNANIIRRTQLLYNHVNNGPRGGYLIFFGLFGLGGGARSYINETPTPATCVQPSAINLYSTSLDL